MRGWRRSESQRISRSFLVAGVSEVVRIEHTAPAAAEVRVVIETSHGMLVEALVDAGRRQEWPTPSPSSRTIVGTPRRCRAAAVASPADRPR